MEKSDAKKIWRGIPASPGIAIGKAFLLDKKEIKIIENRLQATQVEGEVIRFKNALEESKKEFLKLKEDLTRKAGVEQAKIFEAYLLILEDDFINQQVINRIRKEQGNAEFIYQKIVQETINKVSLSKDEHLKDKTSDINAVSVRVLNNLLGLKQYSLESVTSPAIIVAHSLSPGDVVQMSRANILGFAIDTGGKTSHVVLLAKSLGFPAVVGLKDFYSEVKPGEKLILDGERGEIILSPDDFTLKNYQAKKEKLLERDKSLLELAELVAETKDGRKLKLSANIELPSDAEVAIKNGAEGVGLFRTEYLYLARYNLPGEEEQYQAYSAIAKRIHPRKVVIRTFDMGGDKFMHIPGRPYEANPFLGWRAIRACLDLPDIFRTQLRAILRASTFGNILLMFPMISSLEELIRAKEFLNEVKADLKRERVMFDHKLKVGIMIEVPAAALEADSLAKECDFFSIGTNDLIQYTLAVDRANEKVAYLYQSFHPSVLKLIKTTIDEGHKNEIFVGMCGEMAADPKATVFLVGLGIDELSTSPYAVPQIKKIIRSIEFKEAQKLTGEVMKLKDVKEIQKLMEEDYQHRFSNRKV
ncbi:MAG: phosphoenolpyruvate--protein phosphotransferase [candidate division Zixibacteria bacterium]|nr:phosphoenolpyruvate--protein phosphotransferase [candidate division Zixibacteria bacterium]